MEEFKLDLTERISRLEESVKSAHKRIDSVEELTKSVYELASSIKAMQHDISDISDRIKTIEEKPAKRWDLVITTAITAIVGIIVGYFFRI